MVRRRQSGLEEWIEIATKLPWWVALVLAVLLYFVLHQVAGIDIGQHHAAIEPARTDPRGCPARWVGRPWPA